MEGLSLLMYIYVFVLAIFVGFELITKVPPTLHTPLMSGSNAISGITIVGALLSAGLEEFTISTILGRSGNNICHHQRGRRLFSYRQNVKNVQKKVS